MRFIEERIKYAPFRDRVISADAAASMLRDGMTISIPEFGSFYNPMAIVDAITRRVSEQGATLGLSLIKTANANARLEEDWSKFGILKRRMIFFGDKHVRELVNTEHGIEFQDPHLGLVPDKLRHGQLGKLDFAIVAVAGVNEDGKLLPTFDEGYTPVALECADKVLLEISTNSFTELAQFHDVYARRPLPSVREPLAITDVMDRIGEPFYSVDPDKVVGIVISDTPMEIKPMWNVGKPSPEMSAIADYFVEFIKGEVSAGRMPENLLPLQTGAGAIADAVLSKIGESFTGLTMYTEGFMDGGARMFLEGKITKISTGGFSLSQAFLQELLSNPEEYKKRLVIRPGEISNSGEVISRLGVIALNNALEVDLYGNVNSTNAFGSRMISGIGGSGDFARNAYLTVFFTFSTAKDGAVSSIVPCCSHIDHTEHDVDIVVTEYGLADLRNKSPRERAAEMIRVSHPDYRPMLRDYFERAVLICGRNNCHTPFIPGEALSWHERFLRIGSMRSEGKK